MIIDTSAIIACLGDEPDADSLTLKLVTAKTRRISCVQVLECYTVISRRYGHDGLEYLKTFISTNRIVEVAFDSNQRKLACEAWQRFGKGSGHPAQLNFGDCAAYALARWTGEPLLFKGPISRRPTSLRRDFAAAPGGSSQPSHATCRSAP
ncbi:MAG: type II toxin-antitoxin system VapC family toxin [Candidatus Competibacteraceae bacterium]|nr:type II toxin-antitoxin system VapC family toxin [Candidatus Competibacteraceae bacterium]